MPISEVRKAKRDIILTSWGNRWDRSVKGSWTHDIIPNLKRFWGSPRNLRSTSLKVSRASVASDHYLHRIGRAPDDECLYCHPPPKDTTEHTIFYCPHWEPFRWNIIVFVGNRSITPRDIQDVLCGPVDLPNTNENLHRRQKLIAASQCGAQCFYRTVEEILRHRVR